MNTNSFLFFLLIGLGSGVSATELRDVLAHPKSYDRRHLDLVGIARVPGDFYLFANVSAAANVNADVAKALYVRQKVPGKPDYSNLDRQWVRLTGVVRSDMHGRGESPAELTLEQAVPLHDRPAPRIKDPDVIGFFHNATTRELRVETQGGGFWVGPSGSNEIVIHPGPIEVFTLKEKANAPPWDREKDKRVAVGEIHFTKLSSDYQYSPAHSDKRTFYYRIIDGKIELVPPSQGKRWRK